MAVLEDHLSNTHFPPADPPGLLLRLGRLEGLLEAAGCLSPRRLRAGRSPDTGDRPWSASTGATAPARPPRPV